MYSIIYTRCFRPLDGESFSKLWKNVAQAGQQDSFRPLDGESFSKLGITPIAKKLRRGFRPLDGESFSKLRNLSSMEILLEFPSPRRGIIF